MKKILYLILLCLVGFSASASAQSGILIVDCDFSGTSRFTLDTLLPHQTHRRIVHCDTLPAEFAKYEAVFILFPNDFPLGQRTDLAAYVRQGGRLYLEGRWLRNPSFGSSCPLCDSLGITSYVSTGADYYVDSAWGAPNTYTSGLKHSIRFDLTTVNYDWLEGDITKVLSIGYSSMIVPIAWMPKDTSMKVVVLVPKAPNIGYYSDFISRTVCTKFGFCSLGVKEAEAERSDLLIEENGTSRPVIVLPVACLRSELTVFDIRGLAVRTIPFEAGDRVVLCGLPAGEYVIVSNQLQGRVVVAR